MKYILILAVLALTALTLSEALAQAGTIIMNGQPYQACGNATGQLGISHCPGCTIVRWEEGIYNPNSPQPFTILHQYSGSSSFTYNIQAPGSKAFRAVYLNSGGSVEIFSHPLEITASVKPVAGTLSSSVSNILNSGSGQLTLSGHSGNYTWYMNNSPVTLSNGNFNISQNATFYAKVSNGACTGNLAANSNKVTVYVYKTGTLSGPATSNEGSKVDLEIIDRGYSAIVQFEYSINGGSTWVPFDYYSYVNGPAITGDKFADTHEIWTNTKFRVLMDRGPFGTAYTNTIDVAFIPYTQTNANPTNGGNYVKQQQVTVSGITNPASVDGLGSSQKHQVTTYQDGMGRPVQQNLKNGSPLQKDLISFAVYDRQGRQATQYLPYKSAIGDGLYRSSSISEQQSFYTNGPSDKIADNVKPYAKTVFENSPLGRTLEQGGVGSQWQPGSGHSTTITYSNNVANEIRLIKSDGTSSGFYATNELAVVETTDPDGKKQQTFTDKFGRTIVSRVQLDETVGGTLTPWLETYYVYYENGAVKFIISPKGVAALKAGNWSLSQSIKNQYVHQFVYDVRGRLIEKKVPGQAWLYYCYDRLDRLVLVQDGYLRAQNKWIYIKYDRKQRPVIQGLYTNTTYTTRAAIQTSLVDPLYASETAKHYEERGTTAHGYTNQVFPTSNTEVLIVNYYDSYDFDFNGAGDYSYIPQSLPNENTPSMKITGLPTGSKRLILGTNTWLFNYVFYDEKGRVIQSRNTNHLSNATDDLVTAVYDFEGKVITKKTYQNAGAGKITTVINKYTYDHMGRLTHVYQNINGAATDQLLVKYEYNEIGQVVDKKLHNISGTNFLQSVDFRYNIQGWITSINNSQLLSNGVTNDDMNDYFGMEFFYENTDSGLIGVNDINFNGNISAIKWKGVGSISGTTDQKSYKYTYDKSNRLKTSVSQMNTGLAWTKEANAFNENTTYDLNGNILSLQRNQRKHQLSGTTASYVSEAMDNLTYTYNTSMGDQLQKVEDATANSAGFKNGVNQTTEYTYDVAGNLTADLNKGISSITYNILGKVAQINFSDGRKVEYVYDATGAKLTMKNFVGTSLLSTTDYIEGFVYDNGVLDFFGSPEGRVANEESSTNLIANASCSSTSGFLVNQNVTLSSVVNGSGDYVKAVTNQNSSTPGILRIGQDFSVTPGETYVFRVKGYGTSGNCHLYVSTNLGNLVWPGPALPTGASNEGTVSAKFVIPDGAYYVRVGVLWNGPVIGQEMYLNHVELRKLNLEYQYAIADHQGNTRVVFSSNNRSEAGIATFEGTSGDDSGEFFNVDPGNVVSFVGANHTPSGSKVVRMNQTYKVGPSKSLKVFPGDKVDIEVWEYHEGASDFGTSSTPLATLITTVAGSFGGINGAGGESGAIYSGVNQAIGSFLPPGNQGSNRPAAYLNYILFDKDYKVLDMGWQVAPDVTFTQQKLSFNTINIKEPGYLFTYLSYDNASANWVYFDDFKVTHTKTNVIQYNEYYPFGLQAGTSWTRENSGNDFLYNAGSELNQTSGWYEMFYRNYDPTLGRFTGVDPMATNYASLGGYHYSFNSPVMFNDPTGAYGETYGSGSGPELPQYYYGGPQGYTDNNGNWHWYDPTGDAQSYANMGMGHIYANYTATNAYVSQVNSVMAAQRAQYNYATTGSTGAITDAGAISMAWGSLRIEYGYTVDMSSYNEMPICFDGQDATLTTLGTVMQTRRLVMAPIELDFMEYLHGSLDVIGVFDPFGIADGLNAVLYMGQGDWANAGISAAGIIPIAGDALKVAKYSAKAYHAAKGASKVKYIGRLEDLKGIPRSQTLLDDLPNLGSPKANYYQNMSVLRKAIRDGYTIKDASFFRPNSQLAPTLLNPNRTVGQTFLGAERLLLKNRGLWP